MDPSYIDNRIWHDLSTLVRLVGVYFIIINGFVVNFLIAHAIIPSLADSRQLSHKLVRLRPLFYLNALGILATALVVLFLVIINASVIGEIFDRWWI
jgi:hypothetical protein